jgi:hypothetical protein
VTDASPDFEVPLRSHFGQASKRLNRGARVAQSRVAPRELPARSWTAGGHRDRVGAH